MLDDFKKFLMRGNVVDMAVGIIIGAAFGAIVKSLVSDVIMPPIGVLLGGVDFSDLYFVVKSGSTPVPDDASLEAVRASGAAVIAYGAFLNLVINFVVVGYAVFLMIRGLDRLKKAPAPADPTTKDCPECLSKVPIKATRCAHCTVQLSAA
ncbi:MAG: large conductance mechanosensitive channel protein MscL [Planctomycetes bacterium]|nr:large conductance mechanosensitive channel protein MscL [Planctomycetota bacterium]